MKFMKLLMLEAYTQEQVARMVHGEGGDHCGKFLDYDLESPRLGKRLKDENGVVVRKWPTKPEEKMRLIGMYPY